MQDKRKVLEAFKFRKKQYYKDGYIIENHFTKLELEVLELMGKISPSDKPKRKTVKKASKKKEAPDASKD